MKETDKAWFACAIDGEGCILVREHKRHRGSLVKIQISNTNINFLEKAKEVVPEGKIYPITRRRQNETQAYMFSVTRHKIVLPMLKDILPYLIVKKDSAKKAIQFIQSYKWRFDFNDATPELIYFILEEAQHKSIRLIAEDVKKKFGQNIHSATVYKIIKHKGRWIRHCVVCNEPFEVSHKHQRYCPKHAFFRSGKETC